MRIGRRDQSASGVNPVKLVAIGRVGIGLQDKGAVRHEAIGPAAGVRIAVVIADAKVDGPAAVGGPSSP